MGNKINRHLILSLLLFFLLPLQAQTPQLSNDAKISLTGEFILRIIDGRVEREYSPEVGLNLFRF